MNQKSKKITGGLLGGLILVIILVLIYLAVPPKTSEPPVSVVSNTTTAPSGEPVSPTLASTSTSTSTPTPTSSSTKPAAPPVLPVSTSSYQLTIPDGLLPLHPTGNEKFKIFGVSVTKDGFNPSLIVVNQGDGVAFSLKAVDGTYDIFFPAIGSGTEQIEEGQSTFFSFVPPQAGEYVFECRTYCPYGTRITGKLVVLPQ